MLVHGPASGRAAAWQYRHRLLVSGLPAGAYRRPAAALIDIRATEISAATGGFLCI